MLLPFVMSAKKPLKHQQASPFVDPQADVWNWPHSVHASKLPPAAMRARGARRSAVKGMGVGNSVRQRAAARSAAAVRAALRTAHMLRTSGWLLLLPLTSWLRLPALQFDDPSFVTGCSPADQVPGGHLLHCPPCPPKPARHPCLPHSLMLLAPGSAAPTWLLGQRWHAFRGSCWLPPGDQKPGCGW